MDKRSSGILLHITSLPSHFGIGDMGGEAYKFVDFLVETEQTYWQVLPLNPISLISGSSPYASFSAFAGNTLLISPEGLLQMNLLQQDDIDHYPHLVEDSVNYGRVLTEKKRLYGKAFNQFRDHQEEYQHDYSEFCRQNAEWLNDFALFMAFKDHYQDSDWGSWPKEIKNRQPGALEKLHNQLEREVDYQKFMQFIFFKQWDALKKYCNERGIQIIGDIPYYVNYDSAEVWKNPELFKLDNDKRPTHVAGVPPDYFSSTGQLWGNPVYNWNKMKERNYQWWINRIEQNLRLYDIIRIDHFRGFLAYWEVPASESTAINGQWITVPGEDVFKTFQKAFPQLPILAEDLGVITDDVRELMQKFELPGMKILVFAFDDSLPRNPYAPHNHIRNCVVYTGTHDNNTVRGWYKEETSDQDKSRISEYLGRELLEHQINWEFIRMAMMSVANIVIFPLQDVLGLDSSDRMNRPATLDGNWKWRMKTDQITAQVRENLKRMTYLFNRQRSS